MSEENKSGGRSINAGGGMYNEGTINQSGGQAVYGGTVHGGMHQNNIGAGDEAKIKELLAALHQQIQATPATTEQEQTAKVEAQEAAKELEQEIEEVKKNPDHKPNKFQMQGFIAAFKKLGAPVFSAAMVLIGQPALGAAVNQFAQQLPDGNAGTSDKH